LFSHRCALLRPHPLCFDMLHKNTRGKGYSVANTSLPNRNFAAARQSSCAPVPLYSSDREKWNHSTGDLSACKLEMCTVCNTQGCFSSHGVISRAFLEKTTYSVFPGNKELTSKWGSTDSTICFVGSHLQCAALQDLPQAPSSAGSPVPTVVGPGSLGAPVSQGPRCIVCSLDRIFIDRKARGAYTIKLALKIAKNGTVTSIDVQGAPTPEVKSRIEQQTRLWIFEPYLKDGVPVNVTLNTATKVQVIKPR
jgi:hypothetical protein